ncbi:NmrA family protein [Penicillium macrosclerotiorum]|uniref:NmrA family protein n=1 Tax=Penicillium macrosclerotiorum TaxID=303699 RepID=UPI002546DFCE|nr:NmrA family protein [Penicillium macrosclerotiorum]KAJ5675328.1 NmrA family protein [Penicillium macrosclerotiorum]
MSPLTLTGNFSSPKTVTVYGATGNQGGSVVRSLVQNKSFNVIAITRNTSSKAAEDLRSLGVKLVRADGWKKEEIARAFAGSWAAFVNTNSDDPGPTEFDLGKVIIDGIVEAGTVKHLVYSSSISTFAFSDGKVYTQAAEMKSKIENYARDIGGFETVCSVYPGFFMEFFSSREMAVLSGGFPFFPDEDGVLTLRLPQWGSECHRPIPWIAVKEDFGDIVHGILLEPKKYNKKPVQAFSDPRTFAEATIAFQSVFPKKRARYIPQRSWEDFGAGIPGTEEIRSLFQFGQVCDAKYFGEEPMRVDVPAHLKAQASKAMGKGFQSQQLLQLEDWFSNNLQHEVN